MENMNGYDPHIFKSIKYLRDSERMFPMKNSSTTRSGSIRNPFIKHGVVDVSGLILLHKHSRLGDVQALIDYNGTGMARDLRGTIVSDEGVVQKHSGFNKPCAVDLNGLTAQSYQVSNRGGGRFTRCKANDGFAPLGPILTNTKTFGSVEGKRFITKRNYHAHYGLGLVLSCMSVIPASTMIKNTFLGLVQVATITAERLHHQ
ncbi:hypothetical protein CDV31_013452 [Fusarium ambrosium]|uniref:Uncharacterized protein n=1 Tax=Fusarium ambrosium TaxID=131363 RepID=A0A428T356_9HYPO|nr:hypothetical protein CDV31_013452 [Fusarium ambrosium]